MALNLQHKQKVVTEVRVVANRALSVVIADPSGMKGHESTELRKEGRKSNVYVRVVQNTLISRIVDNTPFECLKGMFFGPTIMGFSIKEPSAAARLFQNFSKKHEKFKIKVAVFEKKIIPASKIDVLSSLPTYFEVITKLVFLMREVAIGKFVNVLSLIAQKNK